jgi:hypothetical protein
MSARIRNELRAAFTDSFLKPEAFRCDADTESMLHESGLDVEEGAIYARLSAPGFLDCTEWSGPFETIDAAGRYLIDTYAGD